MSPAEPTDDIRPIKPETPSLVGRGELVSSLAKVAAMLYYQGPIGVDIDRVCQLVKSAAKDIQDHAFHLREDPGYFEDAYDDVVSHDVFMVPHEHVRKHPALEEQDFVRLILNVLAECTFRSMIQPWYTESVYYLELEPAHYKASLMGSFQGWGKVFQTKNGLITDTDLGDPKDEKFLYPSERSAARKPVRQALCKAERHLDKFWAMVDSNITKLCHRPQRRALNHIFHEGGAIRRTKTWHEKFPRVNQSERPEDIFQFQPASKIFHDSSKDVTAKFDKLAVTKKTRKKTRGEPGPAAVSTAQGPKQDLEEKTVYKVDQNAHRVFSALFHIPDEKSSVPRKVIHGRNS
ncbi:hypothetical protein BKA58DRAFT_446448 [Alternaria rosae]|uniref:uncharacterized protein n=1 Tax=Alternaria rosae TaxID=1187941 RepID=UPI001E8DCDC6|nr:uncharacterized protein BKA58DRAFT_446448 [Alternaria rosae]KAH6882078.1 hypothetical protein BKA58DRAFT_446448 [Alternaria rosae]